MIENKKVSNFVAGSNYKGEFLAYIVSDNIYAQVERVGLFHYDSKKIVNRHVQFFTDFMKKSLNDYMIETYPDFKISINSRSTIDGSDISKPRQYDRLFLDGAVFNAQLVTELQQAVVFLVRAVRESDTLFDPKIDTSSLSSGGILLLDDLANRFIAKNVGKKISDSFSVTFDDEALNRFIIQGMYRSGVIAETPDKELSGIAVLDGYQESRNLVYLLEVDDSLKVSNKALAMKCSIPHVFRLVSEAKLKNCLLRYEGVMTKGAKGGRELVLRNIEMLPPESASDFTLSIQ